MGRLNLTLDADTESWLGRYARRLGQKRAGLAREILREGLERREALERRQKLAGDYAAGRRDQTSTLEHLERGQLGLVDDEKN